MDSLVGRPVPSGQPCGEAGSVDSLVGRPAPWTALWGGWLPVDSLVGRLAPSGQPYGLPSNRVRHPVKWAPCVSPTQRSPEGPSRFAAGV